ncbi:MAG TPA: hypothetical protein QF533_01890, partial [Nitrospinota bacterium]|nr:hypothetical protein [Nitrospinota bacterium]
RIHRRPAPQAPVPALRRILQKGTEVLERNYLAQTLKRLASITQKRMPGIKVEKSWLCGHHLSSGAGGSYWITSEMK